MLMMYFIHSILTNMFREIVVLLKTTKVQMLCFVDASMSA